MKTPNKPKIFTSDARRWKAVVQKDRRANGEFFYSVNTTGIYCRPGCLSRLPHRNNVLFHESCDDAERAGFRPCKRCQPRGKLPGELHVETVIKACQMIKASESLPALSPLAKSVGMSPFHFQRIFKKVVGVTPKAFAKGERMGRVRNALQKKRRVTEAIYRAGYNSNGRFYEEARDVLGMKPKVFRAGAAGETIRFAVGTCSLGAVLVAASETGVCAISLGDEASQLLDQFQDQFHKARLIGGDRQFEKWVAQVIAFVDAPGTELNLPLDIRGTAFQQKVWDALRKIPAGSTASYTDIARRIGTPNSTRAVARACATNVIAVAIPCHRVVRSGGALSGYRWGVERKRALLEKEKRG